MKKSLRGVPQERDDEAISDLLANDECRLLRFARNDWPKDFQQTLRLGKAVKSQRSFLAASVVVLFVVGLSYANQIENWNDISVSVKLAPKISFDFYNRTKFGDLAFRKTYVVAVQGGFAYRLSSELRLLGAYRYDVIKKSGEFEYENRFLVQLAYTPALTKCFEINIRPRVEFRYFTGKSKDQTRFRLYSGASRQLKLGPMAVGPYLAGELFYDTDSDELNRFRIYLGTLAWLNGRLAIRLGWIHQFNKDKQDIGILNTGVNVAL